LPHGIWPSGDGTRVYVGLENEDRIVAIDTLTNKVIATSRGGQAAQAVVYVPNAVPDGPGTQGLEPLGVAGKSVQLQLAPPGTETREKAPTSVSLSDQGLVQVLEAAVTGLDPGKPYVLALSDEPTGTGTLESLQGFMTNPAGAAIVNTIGPIRQVVRGENEVRRRYLVIAPGTAAAHGAVVQVEVE
jgi:YVTN family beta-propeller protein